MGKTMSFDQQQFESALEACASEPIHQIGHVQPHGGLLAFSGDTDHRILQASRNIVEFVGKELERDQTHPPPDHHKQKTSRNYLIS